jgi:WD40 repeat protein
MLTSVHISDSNCLSNNASETEYLGNWALFYSTHTAGISSFMISHNSQQIITISEDPAIRVWNIEPPQLSFVLLDHSHPVRAFDLSSDDTLLVSWATDYTVIVWDLKIRRSIKKLKHSDYLCKIWCFKSNQRILALSLNNFLILWDSESINQLFQQQLSASTSITVDCEDCNVYAGNASGEIIIWTLLEQTFIVQYILKDNKSDSVNHLLMEQNSKVLYASCSRIINRWNLRTFCIDATFKFEEHVSRSMLSLSADGNFLIYGSSNNNLHVWEFSSGKAHQKCLNIKSSITKFDFTPDNRHFIAICDHKTVIVIGENFHIRSNAPELDENKSVSKIKSLSNNSENTSSANLTNFIVMHLSRFLLYSTVNTSSASKIVFYYEPGRYAIWDKNNSLKDVKCDSNHTIKKLIILLNEKSALGASMITGSIFLWNLDNGACERRFEAPSIVDVMSASLDCRYLATGDSCESVCLWDIMTGKMKLRFMGSNEIANSIAVFKDRFAIFGGKIRVYVLKVII